MAHPVSLTGLSPREAITDAMYRVIIGLDTNNLELFDSGWVANGADASFEMNGNVVASLDAIHDNMFKVIGPLDTTHFINNVRVEYKDGADTAYLTASALAQHFGAGEGLAPEAKRLLSGSMYFIDLVKDEGDGLWKVKKWAMKLIWKEGDMNIVRPK